MEMPRNIKAILFDFDGTLVDLPTDYAAIKGEISEQLEKFGMIPKSSITASISLLAEARAQRFNTKAIDEKKNAYKILDKWELWAVDHSTSVEGSQELLKKLKCCGIKIAILSRNCRAAIVLSLNYHGFPQIDVILSRDDVENIKPHPEHGLKAISLLDVTKSECLIVGDSWHDLRLGREIGVKTYILQRNERIGLDGENAVDFIESLIDILNII